MKFHQLSHKVQVLQLGAKAVLYHSSLKHSMCHVTPALTYSILLAIPKMMRLSPGIAELVCNPRFVRSLQRLRDQEGEGQKILCRAFGAPASWRIPPRFVRCSFSVKNILAR